MAANRQTDIHTYIHTYIHTHVHNAVMLVYIIELLKANLKLGKVRLA